MSPFNSTLAVNGIAEIIGTAVITLLLVGFQREYQKSYLRHWTFGWGALALHKAARVATTMLPAGSAWQIAAGIIDGVSAFAQIGWFVFGVQELVRRRPTRMRDSRKVLLGLAVAGLVAASLFVGNRSFASEHYFATVGTRSAIAVSAYTAAAFALLRARKRRPGLGVLVLGAAFFFYAVEQARYLLVAGNWLVNGFFTGDGAGLSLLEFLIECILAVGMVACLLEDEREAAALANVEIEHLAYHDSLTGLPNRPLFIDRLILGIAQAHRTKQRMAVLFLDLDRFKEINDSLGHSTGDQLLRAVADRIRRCVREGDTVARFGGDEFTLIIPRIETVEDAAKIAQKILETLKIPFLINDHELFATTSIGISVYPSDGADAETLVRNADAAMYQAKEAGRDNYRLYAPAMNARALERLALENMLRKAITHDELRLHYQPLVEVATNNVVGFEALARWNHPELGLLLPAHFISAAETSGLIVPIGLWVLESACRQLRLWQRRTGRPLFVSVNLSARQFSQPDLLDQIRAVLAKTGLHPTSLELEITESCAMHNAENTIHVLGELKKLGVRIAMDDFGTGYSSLNYLKNFPIDTLKLDQMFVSDVTLDPSAAAIVNAIITLSHDLDLAVVAEGVESEEQLQFLVKLGCDRIQGFYFSPPLAVEDVEPFLGKPRSPSQTRRRTGPIEIA